MPARSRVTILSTLTALLTITLTIAVTFITGPARASTADTITISTPVTVIALGGAGGERLAVTADSTTPLVSMTVHLLSAAGVDTLDLSLQPPPGNPPPASPPLTSTPLTSPPPSSPPPGSPPPGTATWTSAAITPPSLPLGDYSLTVDAADQGGTAVSGVAAGALPFLDTPRITPAASDYVISSANKHPLIDGTISEFAPGAATPTPYADQKIVLDDPVEGNISLTTNGAGAYREALPKPAAGETITPVVPPTPTTLATRARPVVLTVRTAVTGFAATMNPYFKVSFHGCLGLTPGTPGFVPPLAGLVIQYSDSPHGPWRTLGAVPAQGGKVCGNDGRTFTGGLTTPASGAYYRASYPGAAAQQKTTGDLPSASAPVHLWMYNARIDRFTVSRRTVAHGGKLTVSGQLQYESVGQWHRLARQVVQVILLPRKSRTWYWIVRITTSANGDFRATFTDPVTATWSAEYLGDKTHLAAVGAMIGVTLK